MIDDEAKTQHKLEMDVINSIVAFAEFMDCPCGFALPVPDSDLFVCRGSANVGGGAACTSRQKDMAEQRTSMASSTDLSQMLLFAEPALAAQSEGRPT